MSWLENLRRSFLDWEAMAVVLPTMIAVGLKNTLFLPRPPPCSAPSLASSWR